MWEEPNPRNSYIIGADIAEGLETGDFSCADVIEHLTGRQVAQWHGHIDPDLFGSLLYHLGRRYNYAWIAPERNNHGLATVLKLTDLNYKKLYVETIPEPPNRFRKRYGWVTTRKTKPLLIDNLIAVMREDEPGIMCAETLSEMISFKFNDKNMPEAEIGMYDDRVLSMSIAQYMKTKLWIEPSQGEGYNPPQNHLDSLDPGTIWKAYR